MKSNILFCSFFVLMTNVPSYFLKSACTHNLFCAIFFLNSFEFGMMYIKYVQKTFLEETVMWAPSFLVCARLTTCVRAHTLGCPNKTFFKSSEVSPYRKFPYDQNIPHKRFQII